MAESESPRAAASTGAGRGEIPGTPLQAQPRAMRLGSTSHCPSEETPAQQGSHQSLPSPGQPQGLRGTLSSGSTDPGFPARQPGPTPRNPHVPPVASAVPLPLRAQPRLRNDESCPLLGVAGAATSHALGAAPGCHGTHIACLTTKAAYNVTCDVILPPSHLRLTDTGAERNTRNIIKANPPTHVCQMGNYNHSCTW